MIGDQIFDIIGKNSFIKSRGNCTVELEQAGCSIHKIHR